VSVVISDTLPLHHLMDVVLGAARKGKLCIGAVEIGRLAI
jgi:hypothetical protein